MKQKVMMIKLNDGNIQSSIKEYLNERKMDYFSFGGIEGFLRSLIENSSIDTETKKQIVMGMQQHLSEYFWAGVWIGKTKQDKIKISYQEQDLKEKDNVGNYLG